MLAVFTTKHFLPVPMANQKKITITFLAKRYNKTEKTITAWMKRIEKKLGPIDGKDITPRQLMLFVDHVGPALTDTDIDDLIAGIKSVSDIKAAYKVPK